MKIGVPKGRLMHYSQAACSVSPRGAGTWILRIQDIPGLVADSSLDAGIASEEWIRESNAEVVRIAPVCWYHIRICVVGQRESISNGQVRIVSEYPNLASAYAMRMYQSAKIRHVHGACEEYIPILADVAVECVETGRSLRRYDLEVFEVLFRSDVWLISSWDIARVPERHAELVQWATAIRRGDPNCTWQER
jgi:ATP phosphoribosyltransferase